MNHWTQRTLVLGIGALLCGSADAAQDAAWSTIGPIDSASGAATGAVGETIAVDSSGVVYVLQNDVVGSEWITVASSDDDGASWSVDPVDAAGFGAVAGTIAIADDRLHVVWRSMGDNEIRHAWMDVGGAWSAAQILSDDPTLLVDSPQVTVDTAGQVHVFWHEGDVNDPSSSVLVRYNRSLGGGASWEGTQQLSTSALRSAWPRTNLATADGSRLAVAWRSETPAGWKIVVSTSEDSGASWTNETPLADAGDQWDPQTLVDPDGTVHLGIMRYPPDEDPGYSTVEYAKWTSDDGWSAVTPMATVKSRFPHLLYDPFTETLWFGNKDDRDQVNPINTRTDLRVQYSLDGGDTWQAEEMATDFGDDRPRLHGYAVGPWGGIHAVADWTDQAGTKVIPLYVQRAPICHAWVTYGSTGMPTVHHNYDGCAP